jgi:hypothetical protein
LSQGVRPDQLLPMAINVINFYSYGFTKPKPCCIDEGKQTWCL